MKRSTNGMGLGLVVGALLMGVVMLSIFLPMVERNRSFALDMSDMYSVALKDIDKLKKVCGERCEFELEYENKHKETMSKR